MRVLEIPEVVPLAEYAGLRDGYRDALIAHKRSRRLPVGENVTLVFEDRETLRFQVQEMLWVERIEEPEKIQHELDVYNELMPGERELSATLFIEITEPDRIKDELDRLVGIDEHVSLVLGDDDVIPARFDEKQMEEDRISAVQYLRFALSENQAARMADLSVRARARVAHPAYTHEAELPASVRASLISDLTREPRPLLERGAAWPPPDEVLFETQRVRALRPARTPRHIVVEPREPVASLLEADAELLAELLEAVKRAAAETVRSHGACRVQTDVGGAADRLRWLVLAPGE